MKSIHTLIQLAHSGSFNSITVDIFDTVLFRKTWPEGRLFLDAAQVALPIYQEHIDPSITAYEIYSWREFVRRELLAAKYQDSDPANDVDLNLEEWFIHLFSTLSAKYTGKVKEIPAAVLEELINIEMALEKENTQPNLALVNALRDLKKDNKKLKIFFISDMYLTTAQVEELLRHHDVLDAFDAGVTSTDTGNAKHSGRLFHYADGDTAVFKDVSLKTNLHIGDSKHSDVHMAEVAGSKAVYYYQPRLRRARTFAGRVVMKLKKNKAYRQEDKAYKKAIKAAHPRTQTSARYMHDLGFLFSQPMAAYLLHVGLLSKQLKDKHYIFVSSEAPVFVEAGKHLFGEIYDKPEVAVKLNRKRSIHAVAWKLITNNDVSLMPKLIKTIRYGEVSENRKEIYDLLLTKDFKVNAAQLNSVSLKTFYAQLFNDLQTAPKKYTQHLRDDYDYVLSTLPKDNRTVVICDVGWGGTVQAVYTIFAELHAYKGAIEGVYLGVHPPTRFGLGDLPMTGYLLKNVLSKKDRPYWSAVIWEYVYTNKFQFEGDEERLKSVGEGLANGYEHFRSIHVSPTEYFDHVIRRKIKKLLRYPSNQEVKHIGEIRYDFGFNDPQILRIVDTERSRIKFWARLLLKPKATLAIIVAPNNWTGGYIKRFNLIGIPLVLKVLGRLKRTNYL